MKPDELRARAEEFITALRKRLESKGLIWDQLPHVTDIDVPPACFSCRARGDSALALRMWWEWLAAAAQTDDIPYRYDQPRDPAFCIDCTPAFRGVARRAGACQFPGVRFEARQIYGEREVVGVSRSIEVDPATYSKMDDLIVPRSALPPEIQRYLESLESRSASTIASSAAADTKMASPPDMSGPTAPVGTAETTPGTAAES